MVLIGIDFLILYLSSGLNPEDLRKTRSSWEKEVSEYEHFPSKIIQLNYSDP